MASAPDIGQAAPDFEVTGSAGETIRLTDYRGKYLVLYFYPKAFTPGCTAESCSFRDHKAELEALGAQVLGVSMDDQQRQADFSQKHALGFPLLADVDGSVCKAYGAKRAFPSIPKRMTFVIDPQGKIAARFHHELRVGQHLDDVVGFLKSVA